jgi:hypothetical protein
MTTTAAAKSILQRVTAPIPALAPGCVCPQG